MRTFFLRLLLTALTVLFIASCSRPDIDVSEYDITQMHDAMQRGELTSESLVRFYQRRIERLDRAGPTLSSVIEVNPDALSIARALDREWQTSGPRGPLHGIPVILKANIDTSDRMATSAGSLALAGHRAASDAFLVSRLRDAGAVILGKANLSEWANFRSSRSTSGWSSVGGQTRNPYDPTRNACGSSSGSGVSVSANLTAVAVGTETDGSIVCPAGVNGVVGVKPTLGLISRSGIIPIAHSQDTAGPMARTVRDAAILLTAMTGRDEADADSVKPPVVDYAAGLAADALQGKRLGLITGYSGEGHNPYLDELLEDAIAALEAQGAEVVRDVEVDIRDAFAGEGTVLRYEFRNDLGAYLAASGHALNSLDDIIDFNNENALTVMPFFGQERMLEAQNTAELSEADYRDALQSSRQIARQAIDAALASNSLDALIAPTNGPAWKIDHVNGDHFKLSSSSYSAISGYPNVTVPMGFVFGLPIGLSFITGDFEDKTAIELGYAFEQATAARRPPILAPVQ